MVRINKYLAKCNVGSRRKVEEFILAGRVQVNGIKVTDLAYQIDQETDKVKFDNKLLELPQETIYIMLNKPVNYLVTAKDDFDRKTVFDILPDFKTHLFSIGRLDYMSDGLLLLTNDGDFADKIIHPRNKLPK
ncbi:MAG TPA: rRNA pseudouridine synthase, partial [Bacteroidetes bacterium]|nr:rRNA pseudouridine synthase [Bacteroidota bacterium]